MILSEDLVKQSQSLQSLQLEVFSKSLTYLINIILNEQNTIKLNEIIQVDEAGAEQIIKTLRKIISCLCRYRSSKNELNYEIQLLKLSNDKKEVIKQKLNKNLDQLRKKILPVSTSKQMVFNNLQWRLEIEIASKTFKNNFSPNIMLKLDFKEEGTQKIKSQIFQSDFANLKNMHQNLSSALKLHQTNKFKLARNSSV